jgi:hypothetical protein
MVGFLSEFLRLSHDESFSFMNIFDKKMIHFQLIRDRNELFEFIGLFLLGK